MVDIEHTLQFLRLRDYFGINFANSLSASPLFSFFLFAAILEASNEMDIVNRIMKRLKIFLDSFFSFSYLIITSLFIYYE